MRHNFFGRISASLFLITAMLSGICAFTVTAYAQDRFEGIVSSVSAGYSAEDIGIEVYGSRLAEKRDYLKKYEHYKSMTLSTGDDGAFAFDKPSSRVLLKFDLGTLPKGTGITRETVFSSGSSLKDVYIAPIKKIELSMNDDGMTYSVLLYDKDGVRLFADNTVSETYYTDISDINYDNLEDVRLYRRVTVRAGGKSKRQTLSYNISHLSVKGKLDLFTETGILSKEQSEAIYEEYLEDNAAPEYERPEYKHEATLTSGDFMLHYEKGLKNISDYKTILDETVYTYFTQYDFMEPYHELLPDGSGERDPYFHIYLAEDDFFTKNSRHPENKVLGRSKLIDASDVTKGGYLIMVGSDDLVKIRKLISHEIFHGVIYRYTQKKVGSWFSEAFANYGSILCMDGTCSLLNAQAKCYLNSTEYPLSDTYSYKSRHYGEALFPLYMHNRMGGVKTIKNILTEYRSAKNAFDAISRGLQKTSKKYTFEKAFREFTDFNAYNKFYKSPDSGEAVDFGTDAKRTMISELEKGSVMSAAATGLKGSSCRYYEFLPSASSKGILDITISTPEGAESSAYNVVMRGGGYRIPVQSGACELMTFEITSFGASGIKSAVLTAANTSQSASGASEFSVFAALR